jgi:hypothetical protein
VPVPVLPVVPAEPAVPPVPLEPLAPPELPAEPPPDWASWNEPAVPVSFITADCGQAFAARTLPQIRAVEKASLAKCCFIALPFAFPYRFRKCNQAREVPTIPHARSFWSRIRPAHGLQSKPANSPICAGTAACGIVRGCLAVAHPLKGGRTLKSGSGQIHESYQSAHRKYLCLHGSVP